LLAALTAGLLIATWLSATTGTTTAERVLGQSDFGANAAGGGGAGLYGPVSMALGPNPAAAHLYVADTGNNRVLGYRDAAALSNGAAADLVIGQQNFCSTACNTGGKAGAATLCAPSGVAVDSDGNLYVADSGNNRVTQYADPFAALAADQQSAGFIAQRVLGQANLTSTGCNRRRGGFGPPTAATLCSPRAVAIDGDQRLYVADSGNNRVLGYDHPLDQPAGNIVIGQLGFTSYKCNLGGAPSASSLCLPSGVAADKSGHLYVADQDNHRVLEFDAPRSSAPPAHLVFGQPDAASRRSDGCAGAITNADGLCFPNGIALDGIGSLYVADRGSNRVLEYLNPLAPGAGTQGTSGSASDTTADFVFGQNGNFAASARNDGGTTADSLSQPAGVAVDAAGSLYVADTGNNRVLEYNAASVPVGGITPAATPTPESSPCPSVAEGSAQASAAKSNKPVAQAASVEVKVSAAKLAFGKAVFFTTAGGATVNKTLTLTNPTANDFADTLTISGDPSDFAATDSATTPAGECNGTVKAKKSCKITVSFTPTAVGALTATLDIQDSTGTTQASVALTGTGFTGALKFSAKSLSLGTLANGGTPTKKNTKNVTITSTYTVASTISSVGVFTDPSGSTPSTEYSVDTTNCSSMTVVKGKTGSCVLAVTFDPFTGKGADPAVLIVTDDALASPQTVKLTGTATGATKVPPGGCATNSDCTDTGTICLNNVCVCSTDGTTANGEADCNGTCTDTSTDSSNCHTCGTICDTNATCVGGFCTCPAGQTDCTAQGTCANTNTDPSNCGTCGNDCSTGTAGDLCVSGTCSAGLACTTANEASTCTDAGTICLSGTCGCGMNGATDGLTDCGAQLGCTDSTCVGCTDTMTDNNNCGGCGAGSACASGNICVSGTCTAAITCTGTGTTGADSCTANGADPGMTCQSGVCACPSGESDCGSTDGCQNTMASTIDCGVCGTVCDQTGQNGVCSSGTCELGTPTPLPTPNGFVLLAPNPPPALYPVPVGTSAATTITLTNDQPEVALTLTAITITVRSPIGATSEWSETDTCGINDPTGASTPTLNPEGNVGSQCTITATFAPTVGGAQIATLAIASDFTGTAPAAQLVGSAPPPATVTPTPVPGSAGPGTPPPPEINPSVINFSPETIGVTSGDQIVTLKNQSGIPLVMAPTAETITGPFAIGAIDTCEGSTLNANASCVLSLNFTPTGPGSAIGSVTFLDNASGSAVAPQAVQLRGYGTFITLPTPAPAGPPASSAISSASLNLGAVEVGNTSAAKSVTITSTSPTTPLNISAVTITGTGAAQFAETDNCTTGPLFQGQSCTASVTFAPATTGSFQASLVFNDNVPASINHPQSVSLSGSGSAAH